jgi:2-polyprenyl-3-methyl-5-hydroxy-6-metoxy-1,4-benzoquinol methylase
MKSTTTDNPVAAYYDASAETYAEQYERSLLTDTRKTYPADYFRLQLLLNSFVSKGVKRVIEIGVGEGTPLATLGKAGLDVCGIDISPEMVKQSKLTMKSSGMDPEKITWGDIEDPITYATVLKDGRFDALMAMGVMPHVRNERQVLTNMKTLVRPGGSVFIEFRNKLFSLFTFNRYTYEFIMDDLLTGVAPALKEIIGKDLSARLAMDKPSPRVVHAEDESAPGYDAILSKFHNPFEIEKLFKECGFSDISLLWYHYHPAMPFLEEKNASLFRNEALKLEHDALGWRGPFLCSAFVVEAVRT